MKRAAPEPPDQAEDEVYDDEEEEEEKERLIAEETVSDARREYQFKFALHRHYDFESAMTVHVTVLHGRRNPVKVGSAKGFLVDRDFRPRWQFHELCDAESQELQEMSVLFCNGDGTVRYADIDGLEAGADRAASRGGFLQIEMVSLVEAHRQKDVGVRCVKALLEWMNARDEREHRERRSSYQTFVTPEYKILHSSWTLAALMPGLETTAEDRLRWRQMDREGEPTAEEQAREEEREAQNAVARDKVRRQWARLGFRQAKFASEYWYLTPDRLCLKTKAEVAALQITEMPKSQPLAEADEPLCDYFFRCASEGRPATFEKDIRKLVAKGADLNRMHALHRALSNGISAEADFQLLVSLGADPKNTDEMGQTALHMMAGLVGQGEETKARAVVAAKALAAVGVPRSVVDVHGNTCLQTVLKQLRHYADFTGAFNLGRYDERDAREGHDRQKHSYALLVELLEPAQRDMLLGGVLTPRQHLRLKFYVEVKSDEAKNVPEFTKYQPRPSEEMDFEMPYWNHIPADVRGREVYKSFVHGWSQVFQAIAEVLCPRNGRHAPALPTATAVTNELTHGRYRYDDRYTSHFLQRGGRVEYALDGLIHDTIDSDMFFDVHMGDHADEDAEEEYTGLPEHPLDECWDFVRYHILGPKGLVAEGPFRSLEDDESDSGDDDDDDDDDEEDGAF